MTADGRLNRVRPPSLRATPVSKSPLTSRNDDRTPHIVLWMLFAAVASPGVVPALARAQTVAVLGDPSRVREVVGELQAVGLHSRALPGQQSVEDLLANSDQPVIRCDSETLYVWARSRDPFAADIVLPLERGGSRAEVGAAEQLRALLLPVRDEILAQEEGAGAVGSTGPNAVEQDLRPPPAPQTLETSAELQAPTASDVPNRPSASPNASATSAADDRDTSTLNLAEARDDSNPVTSAIELGADLLLGTGDMVPSGSVVVGSSLRAFGHLYARGRFAYPWTGQTLSNPGAPGVTVDSRVTRIALDVGWYGRLEGTPLELTAGIGGAVVLVESTGRSNVSGVLGTESSSWLGWPFAIVGARISLHENLAAYADVSAAYALADVVASYPGTRTIVSTGPTRSEPATSLGSLGRLIAQGTVGIEASWTY